jgi:hypothetical protein
MNKGIGRWPQRRELSESNLLQIPEKLQKKFFELLRGKGIQSLEDLTIPSQPKEEFP